VREYLQTHPPRFVADIGWRTAFVADRELGADEFAHAFACGCGSTHFRVLGVPVSMSGARPGFVLRSMLRVWNELRASASGDAAAVERLLPPIALECVGCGRRAPLHSQAAPERVGAPLEALRCRPCRRSTFEAWIVCRHAASDLEAPARGGEEDRPDAWRLVVRCRTCGGRAEPYTAELRSSQQARLDRLYGREPTSKGEPSR